jgi:hypothetical protein
VSRFAKARCAGVNSIYKQPSPEPKQLRKRFAETIYWKICRTSSTEVTRIVVEKMAEDEP